MKRHLDTAILIGVWLIVIHRVLTIPPTQDEVISFFEYLQFGWAKLIDISIPNNHLVNTLLGKLCVALFDNTIPSFRLANALVGFGAYAYAVRKISHLYSGLMRWSIFFCFLFCYPVFEYFSLARGYGLSFGFMLAAIYHSGCIRGGKSTEHLIATLTFGGLMVWSSVVTLPVAIALSIVALYNTDRRSIKLLLISCYTLILGLVIHTVLGYEEVIRTYFDLQTGWADATVGSLLNLHRTAPDTAWLKAGIVCAIMLSILLALLKRLNQHQFIATPLSRFDILNIIIISCVTIQSLAVELFDIGYPTQRTALFLVPLLVWLIAELASQLKETLGIQLPHITVPAIMAIWFGVDFCTAYSHTQSRVEPYAQLPYAVFNTTLNIAHQHNLAYPVISGDERYSYLWRYYSFLNGNMMPNYFSHEAKSLASMKIYNSGVDFLEPSSTNYFAQPANLDLRSNGEYVTITKDTYNNSSAQNVVCDFNIHCAEPIKTGVYATLMDSTNIQVFKHSRLFVIDSNDAEGRLRLAWPMPPCDGCVLEIYLHNVSKKRLHVTLSHPPQKAAS